MQNHSSRNEILQRIATAPQRRSACVETLDNGIIYKSIDPDSISCFKKELEDISGLCILCQSQDELYSKLTEFVKEHKLSSVFCRDTYIASQLAKYDIAFTTEPSDFINMDAAITGCEFLVARTGSVLVSSASLSGRQLHVFPPVHIVLAHESQLVDFLDDAYRAIQHKYGDKLPSVISTITGPSRTADIEKTLVLGAHGPKVFVVFLCRD